MNAIYKYKIPFNMESTELPTDVLMPADAKVLPHIEVQGREVVMWAIIDENEKVVEKRKFQILGTGWKFDPSGKMNYIGTVQTDDEKFVWHVFEVK